MALCDAQIGLGAQASSSQMELISLTTLIDEILLEQRLNQSKAAGAGAKASGDFAYGNLVQQSKIVQQEANGLIANGSLSLGFQFGGYVHGESLNGKLEEAQTSANNCQEAVDIMERNRPMEPKIGAAAAAANDSPFYKYENEADGFKYGNRLTDTQREELANSDSELSRRNAIDRAKEAKKNFDKTVDSVNQQKSELNNRYLQVGQGLGNLAQGGAKALEQSLYMLQAVYEQAKAGADFLNSTAQALASTLDQLFTSSYGHIATILQTDDALFQADSMRA
jgi:hypothetical protein